MKKINFIRKVSKKQARKAYFTYLLKNKLMTLSVSINDNPWSATVFFAFDVKDNFYFFSKTATKHSQIIKKNPKVALAINQEWGSPGLVNGIQAEGLAGVLQGKALDKGRKIFLKRYPWAKKYQDHALFKIKAKKIFYLDHKLFGHFHRVQIK